MLSQVYYNKVSKMMTNVQTLKLFALNNIFRILKLNLFEKYIYKC